LFATYNSELDRDGSAAHHLRIRGPGSSLRRPARPGHPAEQAAEYFEEPEKFNAVVAGIALENGNAS
jgi:hypothetical protein